MGSSIKVAFYIFYSAHSFFTIVHVKQTAVGAVNCQHGPYKLAGSIAIFFYAYFKNTCKKFVFVFHCPFALVIIYLCKTGINSKCQNDNQQNIFHNFFIKCKQK